MTPSTAGASHTTHQPRFSVIPIGDPDDVPGQEPPA